MMRPNQRSIWNRFSLAGFLLLLSSAVAYGQPNPSSDRPEVQRLCQKWDGTLMISLPNRPGHLRCTHIRIQFDRTAKGGAIFKTIRPMIESIKNQNLLTLNAADFPKDQICSIEKAAATVLTCTTVDFEPEISTQLFSTKSGVLTRAVVSADLDWFRKEATGRIVAQYGVPPTAAFLEYYLDLLVTVSSSLGGEKEQYSIDGNRLVLRLNLQ